MGLKWRDLDIVHKNKGGAQRARQSAKAEVKRAKKRVQKAYDTFEDQVKAETKRFEQRVEAELERIPDNIKKLGNKAEEEYKRLLRKGQKQIDRQLEKYGDKFREVALQYLRQAEQAGAEDPLKKVEAQLMPVIRAFVRPIVQQIVKFLSQYVAAIPYFGPVIAGLMMTAGVEQLSAYAADSLWSVILKQLGVKREVNIQDYVSLDVAGDAMMESAVTIVKDLDPGLSAHAKEALGALTQSVQGLQETAESVRSNAIADVGDELQNALAKIKVHIDPNVSIKTLQSTVMPTLTRELEPYLNELLVYALAPLEQIAAVGKNGVQAIIAAAKESLSKHLAAAVLNQKLGSSIR